MAESDEKIQGREELKYSYTTSTYKMQGNGTDSWVVGYFNDKDEQIFSEIVFKDPTKPDTEVNEKFLAGCTDEIIVAVWEKLINNLDKLPVELLDKLVQKITEKQSNKV